MVLFGNASHGASCTCTGNSKRFETRRIYARNPNTKWLPVIIIDKAQRYSHSFKTTCCFRSQRKKKTELFTIIKYTALFGQQRQTLKALNSLVKLHLNPCYVTFKVNEKFSLEGRELWGTITLSPGYSWREQVNWEVVKDGLLNLNDLRRHTTAKDPELPISASTKGNNQSGSRCLPKCSLSRSAINQSNK